MLDPKRRKDVRVQFQSFRQKRPNNRFVSPLGYTGSATGIFAEIRIVWKWISFQFLGLVGSSEILFAIAIGLVGDTTFAIKNPWGVNFEKSTKILITKTTHSFRVIIYFLGYNCPTTQQQVLKSSLLHMIRGNKNKV